MERDIFVSSQISDMVYSLLLYSRIAFSTRFSSAFGLPPFRPLARAADKPSFVRSARQSLSKEEQKLLYLRFDEELSARTIAMQLGISEGAVRVTQHRILVKLKKKLTLILMVTSY